MPESNPAVGDVWTFQQDPPAPAVIVSELAGASGYQLMARTGRIINVSRPSLRHMWRYTGISHNGPCSIGGCLLPSGVHTKGRWYCGAHAPRNQAVGIPGDSESQVQDQPVNGAVSKCPNCGIDRDAQGAMSSVEGMTIHRCSCRARWIALLAQGIAEDGVNLGEDLQAAYTLLEDENCHLIQAYIGATALLAMRRAFKEIKAESPSFAGIQLTPSKMYGNDIVLLAGVPLASHDDETNVDRLLGTYWCHKEQDGIICRVFGVEEITHTKNREVQLVHWGDASQTITLKESQLLTDFSPSEAPTTTVQNGTTYTSLPSKCVGSLNHPRDFQTDKPPLLTKVSIVDEPARGRPLPGETLWNLTTGSTVQIFGSGRTAKAQDYMKVTLENGVSARFLTEDFLRYFSNDTLGLEIVVGSEYLKNDGTLWILKSFIPPIYTLERNGGDPDDRKSKLFIREAMFRASFSNFVRRSVADRLLDEEDLV